MLLNGQADRQKNEDEKGDQYIFNVLLPCKIEDRHEHPDIGGQDQDDHPQGHQKDSLLAHGPSLEEFDQKIKEIPSVDEQGPFFRDIEMPV